MSADASSATKFCNAGTSSHSPKSTITQTDNDIRVTSKHLITKPIKLMLELLSDVFGFGEDRISSDAFGLASAEVQKVIAWGMVLEDVGAVQLRVKVPYGCESVGVLGPVPFGKMGSVLGSEGDDIGIIQHPKQLGSGCTNEALADLGFVLALGLTEEEDGFHREPCNRRISSSKYHWAFFRFSMGSPLSA